MKLTYIFFVLMFLVPCFSQAQILDDFQVNEEGGFALKRYTGIASDSSGNFAVIWEDERNGSVDIFCQLISSNGIPRSNNFRVCEDEINNILQNKSHIVMDKKGNFIIVWIDQRNGNNDIYGQMYNSNINPIGSNFRVNDLENGTQHDAGIAMDHQGNFVVVWEDDRNGTSDIYSQQFRNNGTRIGQNFKVNDAQGNMFQSKPAIGMNHNGKFGIVWPDRRDGVCNIYCQLYDSTGIKIGSNFKVSDNSAKIASWWPDNLVQIAIDDNGKFMIVWIDERNQTDDLYGQIYNSSVNPVGNNFRINEQTAAGQRLPKIKTDFHGNFLITWETAGTVVCQKYSVAGEKIGNNRLISTGGGYPDIDILVNTNYLISWVGNNVVYSQKFDANGLEVGDKITVTDDKIGSSNTSRPFVEVDSDGNFAILWQDHRNENTNVYYQIYDKNGITKGSNSLVIDEDKAGYWQNGHGFSMNNAGEMLVTWYDNRIGTSIWGQYYSSDKTKIGRNFQIANIALESLALTDVALNDMEQSVITWLEDSTGIINVYAQFYNENRIALGSKFKVNPAYSQFQQRDPGVALDSKGNSWIVWQDQRDGGWDIYCQRYDIYGNKIADNFKINDDNGENIAEFPRIAVNDSGIAVTVWEDLRSSQYTYFQKYNADGTRIGQNTKVNDKAANNAWSYPSVDIDNDESFAVIWKDNRNNNWDIYCQLYDGSGKAIGDNFKINQDTGINYQGYPDIKLKNRIIYATWEDNRMPGTGRNVYARIIPVNAQVTPLENELNVSKDTNINIQFPFEINSATLTNQSIVIYGSLSGRRNSSINYNATSKTATVDPAEDFLAGEVVTVSITDQIKSPGGNQGIIPQSWSFTIKADQGSGKFYRKLQALPSDYITGADYNGDGLTDIITASADSSYYFVGKATRGFTQLADLAGVKGAVALKMLDYNRDGLLDLLYLKGNELGIALGAASGKFVTAISYTLATPHDSTAYLTTNDFNNDGYQDIVLSNYNSTSISLFLNSRDSQLRDKRDYAVNPKPRGIVSADFNLDGNYDVAIAHESGIVSVLWGDGHGSLANKIDYAGYGNRGLGVADFNGDGFMDLAATKDNVRILLNDGKGNFSTMLQCNGGAGPTDLVPGDLDADGDQDIIVAEHKGQGVSVLLNNGDGSFIRDSYYRTYYKPLQLCCGDFDGDRDLDFAATSTTVDTDHKDQQGPVCIFYNSNKAQDIYISQQLLSYNKRKINTSKTIQFTIYNDGLANKLTISDMATSNSAFTIAPKTATIDPRDSLFVVVAFNPAAIQLYTDSLTILSNDPRLPRSIVTLTGIGIDVPSATTQSPTDITGSSAILNGTINPHGDVTAVKFQYGPTISYGDEIDAMPNNLIGNRVIFVTAALQQLAPQTTIHYRVVASNFAGTVYGEDQSFTTQQSTPQVSTTSATNIDTTSATLNGTVQAYGNATVAFQYGVTRQYGKEVLATPATVTGLENVTAGLTGLIPNTVYHYRVKATNAIGTSYGDDVSFTTKLVKPQVVTVEPSNIGIFSGQINGKVNGFGDSTVVKFQFGPTASYGAILNATPAYVKSPDYDNVSATVDGLKPNTTIHYRVMASNAAGTSYGDDRSFTTAMLAPTVEIVAPSNIDTTSATLNGLINANALTTTAAFEYGSTPSFGYEVPVKENPIEGAINIAVSADIFDLLENTQYYYRLRATNSVGTVYSAALSFTTRSAPAIAITEPATNVTPNSATLNGRINPKGLSTTVSFLYGETTAYGYQISAQPSPIAGASFIAVSANLTGLRVNATYHYCIEAVNSAGPIRGADQIFTTNASAPSVTTLEVTDIDTNSAVLNGRVNPKGQLTEVKFEFGRTIGYGTQVVATIGTENGKVQGIEDITVGVPLTGLQINTTYYYRIVASNTSGTTTGSGLTFTTTTREPFVQITGVESVGMYTATIRAVVNAKGRQITVKFQYGETDRYGREIYGSPSSVSGINNIPVTATLTNLKRNTLYHYRLLASSELDTTFSDDQTFTTAADNAAPALAHLSINISTSGQVQPILATITDNIGIKSADVFYRIGGSRNYDKITMTLTSGSNYEANIPASAVTPRGVEYYIVAEDSSGNMSTYPQTNAADNPRVIQVQHSNLSFATAVPSQSYRMVSIPFDLDNSTADNVLGDDLGSYNIKVWRLFRYLNGENIEFGGQGFNHFDAGYGFWLISKEEKNLDAGSGKSVSTAQNFIITLQPGWNQIGNPFGFNVKWSDVIKNGTVEPQLIGYAGDMNDQTGYDYTRTLLVPWEGYFVNNKEANTVTIEIPPREAAVTLSKISPSLATFLNLKETDWALQLTASCETVLDKDNYIGCKANAQKDWDEHDFSEAPWFGEQVSLYFPHPDWAIYPGNYTGDFKAPTAEGQYWDFEVVTSIPTKTIALAVPVTYHIPDDWEWTLLDKQSSIKIDLRRERCYSFIPAPNVQPRSFRILIGQPDFIQLHDLEFNEAPTEFALFQNYPNPFNPSTTIGYDMASIGDVSINVYNLRGQLVRTLITGSQSAGRYQVVWDGCDTNGQLVASGIYLVKMTIGRFAEVRKIILAK